MKVKFVDVAATSEIQKDFNTQFSNIANGVIGSSYFINSTGPVGLRGLQGPTGSVGPTGPSFNLTQSSLTNLSVSNNLIANNAAFNGFHAGTGSLLNQFISPLQIVSDDYTALGTDYGQLKIFSPQTNQAIGISTQFSGTGSTLLTYGYISSVNVGNAYTPLQLGNSNTTVCFGRTPLITDAQSTVITNNPIVLQDTYLAYRRATGAYLQIKSDSFFSDPSKFQSNRVYYIPEIHQDAKIKFGSSNFYQDNVKLTNNSIVANQSTSVNFEGGTNVIQYGDFFNTSDTTSTASYISTTNTGITIPASAHATTYKVSYTINLTPNSTLPSNMTNPFTSIVSCTNSANLQPSLDVSKCSVSPNAYTSLSGSCCIFAQANDVIRLNVQASVDVTVTNGYISIQGIF